LIEAEAPADRTHTGASLGGADDDLEEISTDVVLHLHTATFIHNCYIIFWARQTLNVADGVFRLTAAQLNLSLWGECL
jgi:hypothetical protein